MVADSFKGTIERSSRIGLDTSILIYYVEDHPRHGSRCAGLFSRIERGETVATTSCVSLLEALVQPYRLKDDRLAEKFFALLRTYPGLTWVPVTIEVADRAAELRARYRLRTPDAIQVATALLSQVGVFLGNDKGLRKVKELQCLVLDDLL